MNFHSKVCFRSFIKLVVSISALLVVLHSANCTTNYGMPMEIVEHTKLIELKENTLIVKDNDGQQDAEENKYILSSAQVTCGKNDYRQLGLYFKNENENLSSFSMVFAFLNDFFAKPAQAEMSLQSIRVGTKTEFPMNLSEYAYPYYIHVDSKKNTFQFTFHGNPLYIYVETLYKGDVEEIIYDELMVELHVVLNLDKLKQNCI